MEVNDLVFKELIKRGYHLEGKTRVWDLGDSKLAYLTPNQAQGFLDLSKTESYKDSIIEKEVNLIKKRMKDFVKALTNKSYNIIDLGCGDGKKASLFIEELAKHMKIRYYPVDISSYMVSKAAETIRKKNVGEVLEFRWNISDFENLNNITPLARDAVYENHFLMLLGNTFGNFDKEDILHGIVTSMNEGDLLLIGNGLDNGNVDWIREYKDRIIDSWVGQIIEQLGLTKEEVNYDVRFVNSRIEELYIIKEDKVISHLGKKLSFKRGDVIIVPPVSHKYSKIEFKKMLSKFFSDVKIYTDEEESYALALCKK